MNERQGYCGLQEVDDQLIVYLLVLVVLFDELNYLTSLRFLAE